MLLWPRRSPTIPRLCYCELLSLMMDRKADNPRRQDSHTLREHYSNSDQRDTVDCMVDRYCTGRICRSPKGADSIGRQARK